MTLGFLIRGSRQSLGAAARSTLRGASLGLLLSLGMFSGGCDSGSFAPPRPVELTGGEVLPVPAAPVSAATDSSTGHVAGARAIELILGPRDLEGADDLKHKARSQAGNEGLRLQVEVVGEKDNPGSEAELVRKVIARDALALIVEPARSSDPELSQVISQARDRGLPVVLMGRPFNSSHASGAGSSEPPKGSTGPRGPVVQVVPEPFNVSAPRLVAAAINNARNGKLSPEAGAIVLINTLSDPLAEDRAAALRTALHDAGITTVEELRFAREQTAAKEKLTEALPAHPKIGMVFSTDHVGLTSSFQLLEKLGESHMYVVAGYTHDEASAKMAYLGEFAAIAHFSPERLLRRAIASAASLSRGEKLAERLEVSIPLHVSNPRSGAPTMYRLMGVVKNKQRRP